MHASTPKSQDSSLKPIITLTTDFGTTDTFVAQMKGVIAGIAPQVRVIDGTHGIPPQNILAGALAPDAMVDAFPQGTIHVVVVDPGVGSERAAVVVETERCILVGPDNGLFTLVLDRYPPTTIVTLTNPAYHRPAVSHTFHGRDIFAPVAAHLANGVPIDQLGETTTSLVKLDIPQPKETDRSLTATVLLTDHFGNLITNVTRQNFDRWCKRRGHTNITVHVNGKIIGPVHQTFANVAPGQPVAYFGSSGRLEIAVHDGSARKVFGEPETLSILLQAN